MPYRENRTCPEEFTAVLAQAGGLNPYGEPVFRLAWSGSETIRGGGYWGRDGLVGYREIAARPGPQCWMVMQWEAPDREGSPWLYYFRHRDVMTGMCDIGEYPYHGRWNIVRPLIHVDEHGESEHLELTGFLLSVLVPNIRAWQHLSLEKRMLVQMEEDARKELADRKEMNEAIASCAPAFGMASRTVAKKVEMFERHWREMMAVGAALQRQERGFKQIGD